MQETENPFGQQIRRRAFLKSSAHGFGTAALASMLASDVGAANFSTPNATSPAGARRVIYLFQSGGPSQCDMFDPKPELESFRGKNFPDSIRKGQRITTMTSTQDSLPVLPSPFTYRKYGDSGLEISDAMPHLGKVADDLCVIRSMHTEAINHDPAITFFQTGFQLAGRPSIGSWVSYGLGALNRNLPSYVVLTSQGGSGSQPLYSRLWSSGFLPTEYSGVKLRNTGAPVFYLANPDGINNSLRRDMLDDLAQLNRKRLEVVGDPEIKARIAQYEMAFRMQSSVPELADISGEPQSVLDLYGPDVTKPGTFARNCLLARRLAERDVRFIQLFHMGWDHHANLKDKMTQSCGTADQPTAGLIMDLKQRGLLDDTLVIWGGEFGRTVYAQAKDNKAGRDHHPYCFTTLMAGAGVKGGHVHGETDDFCYNIARDPVHVHDLNATILHLLGLKHEQLTYKFQGRQYRLTDVHGEVVRDVLS
ncbi:MAG: sulfatase [Planctomycetaceae bacterium]|nr:sulfatase [Planctomycetaceae bacterium]